MSRYRGSTFAVGPIRDLQAVYSRVIENRQHFTEVRLEGGCIYAEWATDDLPGITSLPAIARVFPRVRFGTVWGCCGLFIAYGIYAAGVEELSSQKRFASPDEAVRLLERGYAVVEGHLNHGQFRIRMVS